MVSSIARPYNVASPNRVYYDKRINRFRQLRYGFDGGWCCSTSTSYEDAMIVFGTVPVSDAYMKLFFFPVLDVAMYAEYYQDCWLVRGIH